MLPKVPKNMWFGKMTYELFVLYIRMGIWKRT